VGVRLFVGNLDYSVSEGELREYFAPVGPPSQVALPVDRETGRPRGFAFVEFAERSVAEEVIRRFHGQPLKGRPLAISEARAREDRPFSPRPPGGGGPGGGYGGPPGGPRPPMGDRGGPPPGMAPRPPRPPRAPDFDDAGGGRPQRRPGGGGPAGAKKQAKPERGGPKGPIRERGGGRVLDIDDSYEEEGDAPPEEEFDDFATSAPHDEDEDDDKK
jgi:RNA recognition motif-containing protein